jgi:hypothetical protein
MSMTLILVALLYPVTATAPSAEPAVALAIHIQMPDAYQSVSANAPILLSMGPDPGGKADATANSDATKTGQPSMDGTASPNSSSTSNAAGGAAPGSAQSQSATSGSDSSKRASRTGNSPGDSADHSQNAPGNLNPSATGR